MNITSFSLIIIGALLLKSRESRGSFTIQGDHWMNNGDVPDSEAELSALSDEVCGEFELLYELQDAAAFEAKFTDDCVYIHQDLGILRGKEAVLKGYQELFKSGKASVDCELLKVSDSGTLGDDYMYLIAREHFFDKDNENIGISTVLVILKHLEDGYHEILKAEITDLDETFAQHAII